MDVVAVAVVGPAADAADADPVAVAVALIAVATVVVVDGAYFSSFLTSNWVQINISHLLVSYK